MTCNDMRLLANQIMHDIYDSKSDSLDERIEQLKILENYARAAQEQLKARKNKEQGK